MSTHYSGATPVGGQAGYPPEPPQANSAVPPGYEQGQGSSAYTDESYADESYGHAGNLGTPTTETGRPDVEGVSIGQLISAGTTALSAPTRAARAAARRRPSPVPLTSRASPSGSSSAR